MVRVDPLEGKVGLGKASGDGIPLSGNIVVFVADRGVTGTQENRFG